MKKFIHENTIAANADDIAKLPGGKLPQGLLDKISKFNETKHKVDAIKDQFKRRTKIEELDLISSDLSEQIEAEIEDIETLPANPPAPPAATKKKEDESEPKTNDGKPKKKKNFWGWIIGGIVLGGAVAIGIDAYNTNKSK